MADLRILFTTVHLQETVTLMVLAAAPLGSWAVQKQARTVCSHHTQRAISMENRTADISIDISMDP